MKETGSGATMRGELITAREPPFLSSVGMCQFVRSFCCRVVDSSTTGKTSETVDIVSFSFSHVFPLRLRGMIALGEVTAFHSFYFLAILLPFSTHTRADIIRGSRSRLYDLKQNTWYDTLD